MTEKRIALITGASSGIGKAAAIRLAKKGIRMILNARDQQKLVEIGNLVQEIAGEEIALLVCGDISDELTIDTCIQESLKVWQTAPHILLACAGRGLPGTVINSKSDAWTELLNTNVRGLMHQLRSVGKSMLEKVTQEDFVSHPLDIIVIGSSVGRNISPFNSVYGASKFAAHGLTEALRRELGPQGIRVTLIEPGLVNTNFQQAAGYDQAWFQKYAQEVGPVLTGDDVAKVIDFLLELPGNVHLDNISIRPTRQAYP